MLDRTVRPIVSIIAIAAAAQLTGCLFGGNEDNGRHGAKVKAELIKSGTTDPVALPKAGSAAVGAPHWSSDARILSYRTPVVRIMVREVSGASASSIYDCVGGAASCMVELNGPALEDLLGAAPVTVDQGTFGSVDLLSCLSPDTGYTAWVTAEVTLDGVPRYTHPTEILSTTGPAQPLAVHYSGCGRSYALPSPVAIVDSAGGVIPFRLFFDIQDLVWAGLNESQTADAWRPGNCAGPRPESMGGLPFLCTGYADIVGTSDVAAPVLERYYLNSGSIFGIYTAGSNGRFIGGYSRRLLKEGVPDGTGFEAVTPIMTFNPNGDGSYLMETFGGYPDPTVPYFRATAFRREAHTGPFTAARLPGGTYTATTTRP